MKGFNVRSGLCAQCGESRQQAQAVRAASKREQPEKQPSTPSGPKSWKCPNCLKRIDVNNARTALVLHNGAGGRLCVGSGYQLPQKSVDALDYRVAGSFEGGRR